MKKAAILLLIAIIAHSCKSEKSHLKSDLVIANLKGNIWKIDKTIHGTDSKCACPAGMKTECNKSKFVYDKKGNLAESYKIDENDSINEITKYVYNSQGVCTEMATYKGEKLTEKEVPVLQGVKTTGCKIYNENGTVETTCVYIYSGDEISEEKTLNSKGGVVSSVQNEFLNGQLVSQTEKDSNGDVISITKFKRNTSNDIVESVILLSKDNKEYKVTYEYEYDVAGNWIKQTKFYNGQIENIVVRNIEYFKV
jgi:hypothetical protein